jgi:hypothetical protein
VLGGRGVALGKGRRRRFRVRGGKVNDMVDIDAAEEPSRREVSSSGGLLSGGIEVPCAGSWQSCRAALPLLPFPFLPARLSSFIDAAAHGVAAAVPNLLRLLRRQIDDAPLPFPTFPAVARRSNDARRWDRRKPVAHPWMGAAFGAHALGTGRPVSGGVRRCGKKKTVNPYATVPSRRRTPVRIALSGNERDTSHLRAASAEAEDGVAPVPRRRCTAVRSPPSSSPPRRPPRALGPNPSRARRGRAGATRRDGGSPAWRRCRRRPRRRRP